MIEAGEVVSINDKYATVRLNRKEQCEKCGMCGMKRGSHSVDVECLNSVGAKEGNTVVIESGEGVRFVSMLLVFVVPLVLLAAAIAIGLAVIGSDLWTLALCLGTLIAWYTILAGVDKGVAKLKRFNPVIKEITGGRKEDE